MPAERGITHVHGAAFQFSRIAGLAAQNVNDPLGVARDGKRDCIVLVVGAHGQRRHDNDLVRENGAGLVGLGSTHDDPVRAALYHAEEHIGVRLLAGAQATVSFHVGHRTVAHQIVLLDVAKIVHEATVVPGGKSLVHLKGRALQRVEGVPSDAALEAGTGFLAQDAQRLDLV